MSAGGGAATRDCPANPFVVCECARASSEKDERTGVRCQKEFAMEKNRPLDRCSLEKRENRGR